MEVGLPPDLLRLRQPEQAPDDLFRAQAELIDDLFRTQAELIYELIRQRDAADALSARLLALSLVLCVVCAALFALWWLA